MECTSLLLQLWFNVTVQDVVKSITRRVDTNRTLFPHLTPSSKPDTRLSFVFMWIRRSIFHRQRVRIGVSICLIWTHRRSITAAMMCVATPSCNPKGSDARRCYAGALWSGFLKVKAYEIDRVNRGRSSGWGKKKIPAKYLSHFKDCPHG